MSYTYKTKVKTCLSEYKANCFGYLKTLYLVTFLKHQFFNHEVDQILDATGKVLPGGTDLERGYGDVPGHDPLFSGHPALLTLPIYHHCAALMPPFSNFRKNFHFQPCFGQNFSSEDANFRSLDPHFSRKICSLDPTFGNPCGTHPPKKS